MKNAIPDQFVFCYNLLSKEVKQIGGRRIAISYLHVNFNTFEYPNFSQFWSPVANYVKITQVEIFYFSVVFLRIFFKFITP